MKVVVPGMRIDLIGLITNKANTGCDAEIAEPRGRGPTSDFIDQCRNSGGFLD